MRPMRCMAADKANNLYFMDTSGGEAVGRVDAKTWRTDAVSNAAPSRNRGRAAPCSTIRAGYGSPNSPAGQAWQDVRHQGGDIQGMGSCLTPHTYPYGTCSASKNWRAVERRWRMASDRVLRFRSRRAARASNICCRGRPISGASSSTNSTNPVTFWAGNNHGGRNPAARAAGLSRARDRARDRTGGRNEQTNLTGLAVLACWRSCSSPPAALAVTQEPPSAGAAGALCDDHGRHDEHLGAAAPFEKLGIAGHAGNWPLADALRACRNPADLRRHHQGAAEVSRLSGSPIWSMPH